MLKEALHGRLGANQLDGPNPAGTCQLDRLALLRETGVSTAAPTDHLDVASGSLAGQGPWPSRRPPAQLLDSAPLPCLASGAAAARPSCASFWIVAAEDLLDQTQGTGCSGSPIKNVKQPVAGVRRLAGMVRPPRAWK